MRAAHPGTILKDELAELGISPAEFAKQIDAPFNRVAEIIDGKRSITGDTAISFGRWFGVAPQFWLNLQTRFDRAAERQTAPAARQLPTSAAL